VDNDIQLISDGDGIAVIGDPAAVEEFLAAEGLPSKDLGLERLRPLLSAGAATAQAGSEIAANSGRWLKVTKESAHLIHKHGLRNSSDGLKTGVLKGKHGQVKGFIEFAKGPGAALSNPALLAGAAGIMAQLAMQQAMDEITDYLATIDKKLDDVLRAQKDAALADMIGVGFVIEEAMTIREQVGRVSEVTWSKVQGTTLTIATTQAYALRQLDALAEKVEGETKVGEVAKAARKAQAEVREWLGVLARCARLQDAIAILELDRVLDASPDELDQHRRALRVARDNRFELIARGTENLMVRMDAAAGTANAKVLLHPGSARDVVQSSNDVASAVVEFHGRLGIERGRESVEAKRWLDAATEVRDKALDAAGEAGGKALGAATDVGGKALGGATGVGSKALDAGADGVGAARRLGSETFDRASSVTGKLSSRFRRQRDDEQHDET
jgi:hypothetical protein